MLEGATCLAIMVGDMVVLHSSFCCCLSKSKNKSVTKKETLNGSNSFFQKKCPRLTKGVFVVHDLVVPFFEVIAFAVIFILV